MHLQSRLIANERRSYDRLPSKQAVAGSSPVSRSFVHCLTKNLPRRFRDAHSISSSPLFPVSRNTLYWLLDTSVRKIAIFAFSSSLAAWHVKLERGQCKDILLALPQKKPQAYEKNKRLLENTLRKDMQSWARELP